MFIEGKDSHKMKSSYTVQAFLQEGYAYKNALERQLIVST
jgi:hypothetical protein